MQTINGLPAHVLLVHAVVVLLPLAAVLLVLTAVWPAARRRLSGPNAVLALLVVILVPITTSAGEWLEGRVADNSLVRRHAELGDTAIYAAIAIAALAVIVWWRERHLDSTPARGRDLAPRSSAVTAVVAVVACLVSSMAVVDVVKIGDSGAQASWSTWSSHQ